MSSKGTPKLLVFRACFQNVQSVPPLNHHIYQHLDHLFYILEVLDKHELIPTIPKNLGKRDYPQIKMQNSNTEGLATSSGHAAKPSLLLEGPGSGFNV